MINKESMTREELIGKCRYYRGERECPRGVAASFWYYEQHWCDNMLDGKADVRQMEADYQAYGLSDWREDDGVPLSLKATLFNRFSHWMGCRVEDFKKWYLAEYLKVDSEA